MIFHQIVQHSGRINRVPEKQAPVVELMLEEGQYIAGLELRELNPFDLDRKTRDWVWTATVVTPLP